MVKQFCFALKTRIVPFVFGGDGEVCNCARTLCTFTCLSEFITDPKTSRSRYLTISTCFLFIRFASSALFDLTYTAIKGARSLCASIFPVEFGIGQGMSIAEEVTTSMYSNVLVLHECMYVAKGGNVGYS